MYKIAIRQILLKLKTIDPCTILRHVSYKQMAKIVFSCKKWQKLNLGSKQSTPQKNKSKCYNCRKMGSHIAKDCKEPKQNSSSFEQRKPNQNRQKNRKFEGTDDRTNNGNKPENWRRQV